MSLAELRTSLAGGQPADPPVVVEEEPYGVAQVVTPSGLEIYYQAGPKRLYRIRAEALRPEEEGGYPTEWREVPSVSTVLEVLEKGGLSWWGMKVGVAGALKLVTDADFAQVDMSLTHESPLVEEIVGRLTGHKLTVNHIKSAAGDRGTNVHTAFERWVDTGVLPAPQFYPANERGYVAGVVEFLRDARPQVELSEVMVASTDGWAGRFDAVAVLDNVEVVVKTYPKRKPKREVVSGRWLLDLKTSKDVYESYKIQTAAYRQGLQECGYGEVDHMGIVRVTDDGRYELREALGRDGEPATYEDFLNVLETHRTIERLK